VIHSGASCLSTTRESCQQTQTRPDHRYGLVTSASNKYEAERDNFLGRPRDSGYCPSDARLPEWPSPLSPQILAATAAQASSNDEPLTSGFDQVESAEFLA
jgi:hypothetical protein